MEEYKILTKDYQLVSPGEYDFSKSSPDFEQLVRKEALKEVVSLGGEAPNARFLKRVGMEWEPMSDKGHMRYQPRAAVMFELASQHAWQRATELGIPTYQIKGTNMFNLKEPAVKEHADLFGDRLYSLSLDDQKFVMRYAACHQQFAAMKDWNISYKNLPLGAWENADSYRYEQSGSLLLGFRVRKMTMPDMHILSDGLESSMEITQGVHRKIFEEFEGSLGRRLVNLYNIAPSFFEKNTPYMKKLLEAESDPVLLKFVPEGKYYWLINVEHNIIDGTNNPREIATFQIDVGNSKRFGIRYTDNTGQKNHMPIIHTALVGTIERYLYTIFDTLAQEKAEGKKPNLPLWLSPTQTRFIPVNDSYLPLARQMALQMRSRDIRAEVDDRSEGVGKRVAEAEKDFVNYIAVIGEKEKSGNLSIRNSGEMTSVSLDDFIKRLEKEVGDMPKVKPYLPLELSTVPSFN